MPIVLFPKAPLGPTKNRKFCPSVCWWTNNQREKRASESSVCIPRQRCCDRCYARVVSSVHTIFGPTRSSLLLIRCQSLSCAACALTHKMTAHIEHCACQLPRDRNQGKARRRLRGPYLGWLPNIAMNNSLHYHRTVFSVMWRAELYSGYVGHQPRFHRGRGVGHFIEYGGCGMAGEDAPVQMFRQ